MSSKKFQDGKTQTNTDSLFNKLSELITLVTEKKVDIIAITEIFPKHPTNIFDYTDSIWNIPGYTLHHPQQKIYTGLVTY